MKEFNFPKGYSKQIKSLEDFFKIKLNSLPNVIEVENRQEMNLFFDKPTKNWVVACVKNKKIVIFSKDTIEMFTSHKKTEYDKLITHELCHIIFMESQKTHLPMWLNEGLALNLANQKKEFIETSINDVLNLVTPEQFSNDKNAYAKSYWLVKKLLESKK